MIKYAAGMECSTPLGRYVQRRVAQAREHEVAPLPKEDAFANVAPGPSSLAPLASEQIEQCVLSPLARLRPWYIALASGIDQTQVLMVPTYEDVKTLAMHGVIGPHALIWSDGMPGWRNAYEYDQQLARFWRPRLQQWYVRLPSGDVVGPVSPEALIDMARKGRITPRTFMRNGENGRWQCGFSLHNAALCHPLAAMINVPEGDSEFGIACDEGRCCECGKRVSVDESLCQYCKADSKGSRLYWGIRK